MCRAPWRQHCGWAGCDKPSCRHSPQLLVAGDACGLSSSLARGDSCLGILRARMRHFYCTKLKVGKKLSCNIHTRWLQ